MQNNHIPRLSQIYFYLTFSCNLNCLHCWIDPASIEGEEKQKGEITKEDFLRCIEPFNENELPSVKLTGGEPFLHKDFLELLSVLKGKKINTIIETNGTLITEKEARRLRELDIKMISVSLDGIDSQTNDFLRGKQGAFDRIISSIKALKKHELNIQIITSLYRKNKNQIEKIALLAKELGASSLKVNVINTLGRAASIQDKDLLLSIEEVLNAYNHLENKLDSLSFRIIFDLPPVFKPLRDIKRSGASICGICNLVGVLPDGSISICGIGKYHDDLIMGNIKKDSLKDVWEQHSIFKKIREEIPNKLEGVCGKCMYKRYCFGKCRADAYSRYGSLIAPFPFCQDAFERGLFPKSRLLG